MLLDYKNSLWLLRELISSCDIEVQLQDIFLKWLPVLHRGLSGGDHSIIDQHHWASETRKRVIEKLADTQGSLVPYWPLHFNIPGSVSPKHLLVAGNFTYKESQNTFLTEDTIYKDKKV